MGIYPLTPVQGCKYILYPGLNFLAIYLLELLFPSLLPYVINSTLRSYGPFSPATADKLIGRTPSHISSSKKTLYSCLSISINPVTRLGMASYDIGFSTLDLNGFFCRVEIIGCPGQDQFR